MLHKIILTAALMLASTAYAQVNCKAISTFPTTTVNTMPVPTCVVGCPTVRPPRCQDLNNLFPPVVPKVAVPAGAYDAVSCTNVTTLPTYVSKHDGKVYRKCVSKCQNFRPPKCVDTNRELE
jgi:hypothetical protein